MKQRFFKLKEEFQKLIDYKIIFRWDSKKNISINVHYKKQDTYWEFENYKKEKFVELLTDNFFKKEWVKIIWIRIFDKKYSWWQIIRYKEEITHTFKVSDFIEITEEEAYKLLEEWEKTFWELYDLINK